MILYRPDEHEPLAGDPWDVAEAQAAIARVVEAAERGLQPDGLWPACEADLEPGETGPFTVVYLGAAGVAWALAQLGSTIDTEAIVRCAYDTFVERPDFGSRDPSGPVGEAGFARILGDRDRLAACVAANAHSDALEWLLGAPGTMLAAEGVPGLEHEWSESADAVWDAWEADVWTQRIFGSVARYLGAGHGFVGNVRALAGRPDLLGEERTAELHRRAVEVLTEQALVDGDLANWSPSADGHRPDRIRVQWCHGAPGTITSTAEIAPGDAAFTELLVKGGELTWRAGPLRKGAGLCHGTAGNGYAFLKLWRRTGDELWLERARAFAMHAIGQLDGARYSLWTGDVGAALYLQACIDGDDRVPTIDRW